MSILEEFAVKNSEFARYFNKLAQSAYERDDDGGCKLVIANVDSIYDEEWFSPHEAIERKVKGKKNSLWLNHLAGDKELFMPPILKWFQENDITELSLYGQGDTATAYQARMGDDNDTRFIVRIGSDWAEPTLDFRRAWSPFILQPKSKMILENQSTARVVLEILPLVKLVPELETLRFSEFLNMTLLQQTPYKVLISKDLGILPDGTPVYVDPGSLNFKHKILAERFDTIQYTAKWQQGVMENIFCMAKGFGYREPLNWVVKGSSGDFVTKQSTLYTNFMPSKPSVLRIIKLGCAAAPV